MFGRGRVQRAEFAGQQAWTAGELHAMAGVRTYLDRVKGLTPLAAGVSEVLFAASDRDELLAAVNRCPGLLTNQGDAYFEVVALFTEALGEPRVTEVVRERKATVKAIREGAA